jgi:sucrose-6-phosphate hydrolase SacC (GH32 family)
MRLAPYLKPVRGFATMLSTTRFLVILGLALALAWSGIVLDGPGASPAEKKRADILIADFEGEDYGDWKVTGDAFGRGPARGTLPNQMPVTGFLGKGLVNSFHGGDKSTGTLTSPAFKLQRNYIKFLIGGGKHPGHTCINLLVGGRVVRTATGPNDRSGGSEHLDWHSWDVAEFTGKTAVIQIVDTATGGWGHITVDHIVQTDRKPPRVLTDVKRPFKVEARYLNLPIKNGAKKRAVTLFVDGKPIVRNDIELADGWPDWWAPMDVAAWKGKTITLQVDRLPEDSAALKAIQPGDKIKGGENLYREPLRGQFHFSPRRGWNNDPNGLVYYGGEYHLFFQHNPYGWGWGNMHWGHAVSKDLVHWVELGDALLPDAMGPMFSGSAVVDRKKGHTVHFLTSPNLKDWKLASVSEAGGKGNYLYKCPDFFELPVDAGAKNRKWVLMAANTEYAVGTFDGTRFKPEHSKLIGQRGMGFYAPQTFSDLPGADGRRIQIGWFQTPTPSMPFNQSMTIPLELKLTATADGPQLTWSAVKELEALRAKSHKIEPMTLELDSPNPLAGVKAELVEMRAEFEPARKAVVTFSVRGATIAFDAKRQEIVVNSHRAPAPLRAGKQRLTVFCDRTGLEVFASGGLTYVPLPFAPPADNRSLAVAARGGTAKITSLTVHELRSAWKTK